MPTFQDIEETWLEVLKSWTGIILEDQATSTVTRRNVAGIFVALAVLLVF